MELDRVLPEDRLREEWAWKPQNVHGSGSKPCFQGSSAMSLRLLEVEVTARPEVIPPRRPKAPAASF